MGDTLASYVVGVQVKGQNVAMKEINAIKKAGKDLSKTKITANVGSNKSAAANFRGVRSEINARKELERVKRTNAANSGRSAVAKMQQQRAEAVANKFQSAGGSAVNTVSTGISGGATGLAASLPGLGSLFAASSSAIAGAAQQYVNGITAGKNIALIETSYSKAFKGAAEKGTSAAISGGMFATRETQSFYADLVGQGANAKTLAKPENLKAFNDLAKAQGVGSLQELFGRIQSGTLKEGAAFGGLTKTDIDILAGQGDLLNDRYTKESGVQGILRTITRRRGSINAAAGTGESNRLGRLVKEEGTLRESAESFEQTAAGTLGRSGYDLARKNQLIELKLSAKSQKVAQKVEKFKQGATEALINEASGVDADGKPARPKTGQEILFNTLKSGFTNAATPDTGSAEAPDMKQKNQRYADSVDDLTRANERAANSLDNFSNKANGQGYGVNTNTGY